MARSIAALALLVGTVAKPGLWGPRFWDPNQPLGLGFIGLRFRVYCLGFRV